MSRLIAIIDTCSLWLGRLLGGVVTLMVLAMTSVVVLRYGFGRGSIFLQDLVTYLYATVLMLGAGFALRQDAHVRVDIFYRRWALKTQAWVNLAGTLACLLPFCVFVLLWSHGYVAQSWRIHEASAEPGGIPAVFLLKTLIPAMAVLLLLQGLAEALRAVQVIRGHTLPPNHIPHEQGEVL